MSCRSNQFDQETNSTINSHENTKMNSSQCQYSNDETYYKLSTNSPRRNRTSSKRENKIDINNCDKQQMQKKKPLGRPRQKGDQKINKSQNEEFINCQDYLQKLLDIRVFGNSGFLNLIYDISLFGRIQNNSNYIVRSDEEPYEQITKKKIEELRKKILADFHFLLEKNTQYCYELTEEQVQFIIYLSNFWKPTVCEMLCFLEIFAIFFGDKKTNIDLLITYIDRSFNEGKNMINFSVIFMIYQNSNYSYDFYEFIYNMHKKFNSIIYYEDQQSEKIQILKKEIQELKNKLQILDNSSTLMEEEVQNTTILSPPYNV